MAEVKGVWILDYAKMIKNLLKVNPEKKSDFDEWLTEKDWEIINSMILPVQYYPYECFQRIGQAVFKVVARSNLDASRAFGRKMISELLKFYKRLLVKNDPLESLKRFISFHTEYFKEVQAKSELIDSSPKSAVIRLKLTDTDKKYPEAAEAFAWQLGGSFEQLAAVAEGKKIKLSIIKEPQGDFIFNIQWE